MLEKKRIFFLIKQVFMLSETFPYSLETFVTSVEQLMSKIMKTGYQISLFRVP